VLRFDGVRVAIYPNDHRPAHVHAIGADGEAVFVLNCPHGPLDLRESFGFSREALNRIATYLTTALAIVCANWSAIHGDF